MFRCRNTAACLSNSVRVRNVGSLSWFATVYVKKHISFTAAYGLPLGCIVIAAATAVVGRQYYGTFAPSTRSVNRHAYSPQSGLRTEATLCRKRLRLSRAPAGAASACPTHGHSISLSTTRGLWRGALSLLTSSRAACVLVAFCKFARHHRSSIGSSLIPSSIAFVIFYICFNQMQNNLISQAAQMEASGTPNNLLPAMNQVGCIVLGPLIQG